MFSEKQNRKRMGSLVATEANSCVNSADVFCKRWKSGVELEPFPDPWAAEHSRQHFPRKTLVFQIRSSGVFRA